MPSTRLYLSDTGPPDISPAYHTSWGETANALARRRFVTDVYPDGLTTRSVATVTPGLSTLHRQYVSDALQAGSGFVAGTDTFSCQIQGLESAVNDNIINRVRVLRIFAANGTTVQATLLNFGNASSVVEWNTVLRNLEYGNGSPCDANYTTVAGDRLVLEVGSNDSAGATITGSLRYGADSAATGDLPQDQTDLSTTLRPWFQSNVTQLKFQRFARGPRTIFRPTIQRASVW